MATFEEEMRLLEKGIEAVAAAAPQIFISSLEELRGVYLNRIFKRGLASDGRLIERGYRSPGHRKKRRDRGRQVRIKDLNFTSDLLRSVQTGVAGNSYAMGFISNQSRLIASGQEQQTKRNIWEVSETEERIFERSLLKNIDRVLLNVIA